MLRSLLGTRIRERRRHKKLSQTALAKKAGISVSYMNLIEHNHRDIAGRTLLAIADALDISSEELSEGADHTLLTHLQEAAIFDTNRQVEINRIEEFVGRFPGWAKLTETLYENTQSQNERLQALSDRLGQDPFLADAMHLMLSNITAIQSTSDILATSDDIPEPVAAKFLDNMKTESERLADTIVNLLAHFDETRHDDVPNVSHRGSSTQDTFWESRGFYIPDLEAQAQSADKLNQLAANMIAKTGNEKDELDHSLQRYISAISKMPIEHFVKIAHLHHFDPVAISEAIDVPIEDVFFRFAHLPETFEDTPLPQFGLIECDGAGGVIFRKPLQMLSLPKKSSACPLWPLYRAISQPMQPLRTLIEPPTGESLLTYSYAHRTNSGTFNLPGTVKSSMIFTADHQLFTQPQERKSVPSIQVGITCEICLRRHCSARRTASILSGA